jgi:hypothetical protein
MTATFRDAVQWVIGQLTGDTVLNGLGVNGIYFYLAPENVQLPYIILQKQTDAQWGALDAKQSYSRNWIVVKCVADGTDGGDTARQVMDRVHELVDYKSASVTSGKIMSVNPQTGYELKEAESGNLLYIHVGSVFVFWLS